MVINKSLEDLEESTWDKPEFSSNLAEKCKELWSVPIDQLSIENLRMLIGQYIGLPHLVPVALDILENNPIAQGDFYKGDLLSVVVNIDSNFWSNNRELNNRLVEIKIDIEEVSNTLTKEILPKLRDREFL